MADTNGSDQPQTLGVHDLTLRLEEAQEILRAIRCGEVDALSIRSGDQEQVYTLHGSDRIYRTFIEEMNESAVILDKEGMILYGNARLAEALGSPQDGLVGTKLRRFVPAEDQPVYDNLLQRCCDGEERRKQELKIQAKEGATRRVILSLSRVSMDATDTFYYAALLTDVTDLRQVQEALLRANDDLERRVAERTRELEVTNSELEEFAYVASHDLRAPLRAVASLASWIEEDATALDDENRDRLRLMRERVGRMDGLIEDMLAYARLGRTGTAEPEAVDLSSLLRELIDGLGLPASFQVQLEEPLPSVMGVPLHLRQIFQNLINNAVQHHDRPEGHVWVRADDAEKYWRLEVADDGPGIPAASRGRIFKMFSTSSSKGSHTGIGLAVVRKLVLANGGRIETADNQPRGALFRIFWPK